MNEHRADTGGDGAISGADAIAALEVIRRNVERGLLPTTGGAVSLMHRDQLDRLYEANVGADEGFAPVVPDTGGSATSRDEWYVAAIEQAIFHADPPFRPDLAAAMDTLLDSYRGMGIDWARIHAYATRRDSTIPTMGGTYWSDEGEPTVLAFCGEAMRERVANAHTTSAPPATARPTGMDSRGLGAPPKPRERPVDIVDRLKKAEAKHRRLQRTLWGLLLGLLVLVVVVLATAEHWTKVDVPRQPATFHTVKANTGTFTVTDDGVNPCYVGQDWTECINEMIREYNPACSGVRLDFAGERMVCRPYRETIDQMKQEDQPGWIVETLGQYGHLTRRPIKETRRVSNRDSRPAVTHEAVCYLGFLGECPDSTDRLPKRGSVR